ncbi:MAG: hypothetical protein K2K35_06120, partial [Lachnospiraceae bacterium]|nr:hypothetical protein [Lachnospiraceae bacterium]
MTNYLKRKKLAAKLFIISFLFIALIVSGNSARAAGYSASLETDRSNGVCTYTVNGIDTSVVKEMTLKVTYTDDTANNGSNTPDNNGNTDSNNPGNNGNEDNTGGADNNTDNNNPDGNTGSAAAGNKGDSATDGNTTDGSTGDGNTVTDTDKTGNTDNTVITALEQKITLDETNCTGGTYTGTFSLDSLEKYLFKEYDVSFIMGTAAEGEEQQVINAGKCDFTIHTDAYKLEVTGNKYDINRTFGFKPDISQEAGVPGTGNKIRLIIWKNKDNISKAVPCGVERELTNVSKTWETDLSTICSSYGKYSAAIVLEN